MWEKVKQTLRSFMTGRYGIDQLSTALIWSGLALYVLDMFFGIGFFSLLGMAAYVFALYRMLSKDCTRRMDENRKYLTQANKLKTGIKQAKTRFENRKEYKYFRCPQCRQWIRMKRGTGEANVTCRNCHHSFSQKA